MNLNTVYIVINIDLRGLVWHSFSFYIYISEINLVNGDWALIVLDKKVETTNARIREI